MIDFDYMTAVELAKTHKRLYHYTTLESLNYIINNKSLKLSRIDQLNDSIENANILDLWKNKVYVSCFTYRDYESYFFWKVYAKGSSDGVRISFDRDLLLNLPIHPDGKCIEPSLNNYEKNNRNKDFTYNINSTSWSIFDYSCVDIMYVPRGTELKNGDNFQGRIKYSEWDMEFETRLRVAIRPNRSEYEDKLDKDRNFIRIEPHDKCVFAKLSEECLNSMIITLSPFANDDLCKKVNNLLIRNGLNDKVRIMHSVLSDEIRKE